MIEITAIQHMKIKTILIVALAAGLTCAAMAEDASPSKLPPPSAKKDVTYATDIKPIFDKSCVKCHSGVKAKAKLQMDTLDGVLKGAKSGKVLKPGDSAESFIVKSVAHATKDNEEWMPPLENRAGIKPLTPEQIGLIRAWIDQGAK